VSYITTNIGLDNAKGNWHFNLLAELGIFSGGSLLYHEEPLFAISWVSPFF
jgi:hypothetical protein